MNNKSSLLDCSLKELKDICISLGESGFRAEQLLRHLYTGSSLYEASTLSKAFVTKILDNYTMGGAEIYKKLVSNIDGTIKYLFKLEDNNIIEGVLMQYSYGNTICISSQVGCRMGCGHCASTIGGLVRNLTPGEMLGQVISANADISPNKKRAITNIVMMGSGEPLDNYDNVIKFLELIREDKGFGISHRNISISTCGIAPKIYQLADIDLGITLSISLHAPNDEIRNSFMPINNAYPILELMKAVRYYVNKTSRRVIIEYTLINGVNDSIECAAELAKLLKGLQCHVNLIPMNAVDEKDLRGSTNRSVKLFLEELTNLGISSTVRREMGADINGACGQLRRSEIKGE